MSDMKKCSKCGETKALAEFNADKRAHTGLSSYCKVCRHATNREWRRRNPEKHTAHQRRHNLKGYGMTPEEYEERLAKQGLGCAICGQACSSGRRLAVDHNHATGVIRGLLCGNCNHAIGKFKENRMLLLKALAYLQKHDT